MVASGLTTSWTTDDVLVAKLASARHIHAVVMLHAVAGSPAKAFDGLLVSLKYLASRDGADGRLFHQAKVDVTRGKPPPEEATVAVIRMS